MEGWPTRRIAVNQRDGPGMSRLQPVRGPIKTENFYGNLAAADHQRSGSRQHVCLVALGYTMVYGIINLINFAHGEVLMVGALTSWTIIG